MGLARKGKVFPKPQRWDAFESFQRQTEKQQLEEKEVQTGDVFPDSQYFTQFALEVVAAADTSAGGTSTNTIQTLTARFLINFITVSAITTAGTTTFARVRVNIVRGSTSILQVSGYMDTGNPLNIQLPINNFVVLSGDVIQISNTRTTTAADWRIHGAVSLISLP